MTIFPKMFQPVLGESIIKRACRKKTVTIKVHDIRDFTDDRHRKVDDKPFGGGPGMVMTAQPIYRAVENILKMRALKSSRDIIKKGARLILLTPQGRTLDQKVANKIAAYKRIVMICGHYEGIDERVRAIATDEISIGDYVLTGGELPAMVLTDAVVRLVPGALGDEDSVKFETFQAGLIEHPHYTRPRVFRGMAVPKVLLNGDHEKIEEWRQSQSLQRTRRMRKDLLKTERKALWRIK